MPVAAGGRKRRKHEHAAKLTATRNTATSLQFDGLPKEVIANIANCLDRTGSNNLRLMNKKIKDTVDDPRFVAKPWPSICPPVRDATRNRPPYSVAYSRCGNRLAVGLRDNSVSVAIQVWDRVLGLLGEFEYAGYWSGFDPVFSPEGDILLVSTNNESEVVTFHLPKANQRGPVIISNHVVNGTQWISSVAFLSNSTIVFADASSNITSDIKTCRLVTGANGRLTFTSAETVTGIERGMSEFTEVASSDERKGLFAFAAPRHGSVHFYDVRRGVEITRTVPDVQHGMSYLAFSHDGRYLVVRSGPGALINGVRPGYYLSLFNCDVDQIEDIALIATAKSSPVKGIRFLPYSTTIMAHSSFHVLDVETLKNLRKQRAEWKGPCWDTFSKVVHKENLRALAS